MCPGTELNRYDRCGSPRFKSGRVSKFQQTKETTKCAPERN
jgi:hypothetical protein